MNVDYIDKEVVSTFTTDFVRNLAEEKLLIKEDIKLRCNYENCSY